MDHKTQNNLFLYLERLWLGGIILSILLMVYFLINRDNDSALFFFGFFILCSVIYLMRKRQRKKHAEYLKWKEEQEQNGKSVQMRDKPR